MQHEKHTGFVVGSDTIEEKIIWKVRVKDPTSPFNGRKLVVASVHNELALARGLNVTFVVGTLDNPAGEKVLRAVDVCIENPKN